MPNAEDQKPSDAKDEPSVTHLIKISDEIQQKIRIQVDSLVNRFIQNLPLYIESALNRIVESYLGLQNNRYRHNSPLRSVIESKSKVIATELLKKVDFTIPENAKKKLIAQATAEFQIQLEAELSELVLRRATDDAKTIVSEAINVGLDVTDPVVIKYPSPHQIRDPNYGETALEQAFLEHELRHKK